MSKMKTDSYFVTIHKTKAKTFIRRKKRKGLHGYPRTLSLKDISKCLVNTNINYPKLLRNRFKYVDEEFIEETKNINELSNIEIMDKVVKVIVELNKIEIKNKKINWASNSDFFKFNLDNLKKVLKSRNINNLDIYYDEIDELYKELDNERKLCFIHGDIHRKNMIINNDNFYLIDWELATYGDLAYEIATHFILMEYSALEKELFLNKLSSNMSLELDKLKYDIEIYISFEMYRRKVLKETRK